MEDKALIRVQIWVTIDAKITLYKNKEIKMDENSLS